MWIQIRTRKEKERLYNVLLWFMSGGARLRRCAFFENFLMFISFYVLMGLAVYCGVFDFVSGYYFAWSLF